MPINRRAIIDVLHNLSLQKGLKCTMSECMKGALMAGGFAFGGGLLGGPTGMGIGGAIGSVLAALTSRGKFKSVAQVLSEELTPTQKRKLEDAFINIFRDIDATDVATVVGLILRGNNLQELVLKQLATFLKNEMNLYLMS